MAETLPYFSYALSGPLGGTVTSAGGAPIHLSGLANVVVGAAAPVSGGDGLTTILLGGGFNTISLGGAFNTVVLGDGTNVVDVGAATGAVAFAPHTLQASFGGALVATLASDQWTGFAQSGLPGAIRHPGGWSIGSYNQGAGDIGVFNGVGASATSGTGDIGAFSGDGNGGAGNGNGNIGAFNGDFNGAGSIPGSGENNGNRNVGLLNGDANGNLVVDPASGNGNGDANAGVANGNRNGNGIGPTETPSTGVWRTITGGFDTVVVGNGWNTVEARAGASTVVAGDGVNVITVGGALDTVVTGAGASAVHGVGLTDSVVALGPGTNVIVLDAGSGDDTIVLPALGDDVISGFSIAGGDRLDIGFVMSGTGWTGDPATLDQWLGVEFGGGATVLAFTADGRDVPIAELIGVDLSFPALMPALVIDGARVVPEPGAALLFALGLAALAWRQGSAMLDAARPAPGRRTRPI